MEDPIAIEPFTISVDEEILSDLARSHQELVIDGSFSMPTTPWTKRCC